MHADFKWRDEYSVGVEVLDDQHRQMFELAERMISVQPEETRKLIVELYRYVAQHFAVEESHMKAIGYPDFDVHRRQHEQLIENLNGMTRGFVPTARTTLKLKMFFFDWLRSHILKSDRKYFEFARMNRK
jgi:hemerythrin